MPKFFTEKFYTTQTGIGLAPVCDFVSGCKPYYSFLLCLRFGWLICFATRRLPVVSVSILLTPAPSLLPPFSFAT
ncbi:hypothetical protein SAMN02745146_1397 [Hymenobacter daecheongensis DSM 21074]|uniref:Uncharacterized protein n=1 Tax=Hymenobacter daecheongensis DSM 21074 TaxID=1121955 RepID=A0A1M6D710_9BACT|nr:hypothetical protein SAMN02745146_1397 [Hymenobacter daecheongensis DSM 21074]